MGGSDTPALRSLKALDCVAEELGPGCTVPLLLLSIIPLLFLILFKHRVWFLEE